MDHLYELGKRIERLLYSSVIVIIASLVIFSLSNSIIVSSISSTVESYQNFRNNIVKSKVDIENAKNIIRRYVEYKEEDEKRRKDFDKKKVIYEDKKKYEEQNKIRKKLGLPIISLPDSDSYIPLKNYYYDIDLIEINKIVKKYNIEKYRDLESAINVENDILISTIGVISYRNYDIYKELHSIIDVNKTADKITEIIDKKIEIFRNSKLKIFDVETPLNVPFSIGDMKSSVSLYNVEKWSMLIMPVFLVIWLGSILITRRFEIYFILENRQVTKTYPHILSIFNISESKYQSKKIKNIIEAALLGDAKSIKEIKTYSYFAFFLRAFILIAIFMMMTIPAYYGFYSVIFNQGIDGLLLYLIWITIGVTINIVQMIGVIEVEARIINKTFILNGNENEII
ncbi:hypothetical protein AWC36_01190 [Brenneria goodwinii]|uniref:hypothetical protein n=2 Tax=Brenneria goodwinii TaxID=1109412 RepID=UPI000BAE8FC0|nr:hypothetical protein [Brenneria goodwinii]ATA22836.1 hypothetical protein AWC36_01190 [Brenneria goodwinii]